MSVKLVKNLLRTPAGVRHILKRSGANAGVNRTYQHTVILPPKVESKDGLTRCCKHAIILTFVMEPHQRALLIFQPHRDVHGRHHKSEQNKADDSGELGDNK